MDKLWGKTSLAAVLSVSLLLGAASGGAPAAQAAGVAAAASPTAAQNVPIQIALDDYPLPFDSAPKLDRGVTLVPFRAISEALGIAVVWEPATQTIRANGPDAAGRPVEAVLKIGSKTATVNGAAEALAGAPVMQSNRVLIPLAFFARAFGAQVGWDQATHTVSIRSPRREMRLLGFYAIGAYSQVARTALFNDVAFGWSQINESGVFSTTDKVYQWPQAAGDATPESIVQNVNAQASDSYLMALAVDGKRQLTKVLTDETARNDSIEKMAALAKEKGFKGVMLDFEGLGWMDDPVAAQKQYVDYVRQLAGRLQPDGTKLALALPPLNGAYKGYDYGALSKLADEIVIMAYGYHADAKDKSPEPIERVDQAVRLALDAGAAKSKLLLGINMDNENETSVGAKLGLAKRYGLAGAALWRLGILTDPELQAIGASVVKKGGR